MFFSLHSVVRSVIVLERFNRSFEGYFRNQFRDVFKE